MGDMLSKDEEKTRRSEAKAKMCNLGTQLKQHPDVRVYPERGEKSCISFSPYFNFFLKNFKIFSNVFIHF